MVSVALLRALLFDVIQMKDKIGRISGGKGGEKSSGDTAKQSTNDRTDSFAVSEKKQVNNRKGKSKPNTKSGQKLSRPCVFCEGDHRDELCSKYRTVEERKERAFKQRLCYKCLDSSHQAKSCTRELRECRHCKNSHLNALCKQRYGKGSKGQTQSNAAVTDSGPSEPESQSAETTTQQSSSDASVSMNPAHVSTGGSSLLMTADAVVMHPTDHSKTKTIKVFFDPGSQRSFATEKLAQQLQLPIESSETLNLFTFSNSKPKHIVTNRVNLIIYCELSGLLDNN